MLTEREDEIPQDVAPLDIRSRRVAPRPDGVYPVQFQCPFDGCEATFSNASDCDRHVTVQKHPKKRQGMPRTGFAKVGILEYCTKKKEMRMTMGVMICDNPFTFKSIRNSGKLQVCCIYAIV